MFSMAADAVHCHSVHTTAVLTTQTTCVMRTAMQKQATATLIDARYNAEASNSGTE